MLSIENLLIDGRKEPLDASLRPSFSWRYSDNSNSIPASYRLLVKESGITLWDSGEKEAKRNFGILYRGKKLQYRKEYQVILVVKTKDNECVSFSTHFETRIGKDQWLGTWIGVPDAWNGGALSIRKELDSFQGKNVKKARCYVAGIGYHEFYVNGHKIGDALLEPGVTDYDQKVLYRTYDITKELCLDKNVLGFLLGYGWYGNRKLRMQLYVDFTDGSTYEAHSYSNYNWWFAPSPIIRNSIYSGESYDARIEDEYPGGFSSPDLTGGYNHHWFGGIHSQQNMGELVPEEMNPIRALGEYPGERIHTFNPNHFVYDIKQNIAGFYDGHIRKRRFHFFFHLEDRARRTDAQKLTDALAGRKVLHRALSGLCLHNPLFVHHSGIRFVRREPVVSAVYAYAQVISLFPDKGLDPERGLPVDLSAVQDVSLLVHDQGAAVGDQCAVKIVSAHDRVDPRRTSGRYDHKMDPAFNDLVDPLSGPWRHAVRRI